MRRKSGVLLSEKRKAEERDATVSIRRDRTSDLKLSGRLAMKRKSTMISETGMSRIQGRFCAGPKAATGKREKTVAEKAYRRQRRKDKEWGARRSALD